MNDLFVCKFIKGKYHFKMVGESDPRSFVFKNYIECVTSHKGSAEQFVTLFPVEKTFWTSKFRAKTKLKLSFFIQ
jgi:hypothetical protein